MNNNDLAPIVLFCYRRIPNETIDSLLNNLLSKDSKLFIFSDGFKNNIDKNDVLEVRKYLKEIKSFRDINIIYRDKNFGLANNIIQGVSEIIKQYGKVIVLEDDLIVSSTFLDYMNNALNFYIKNDKIASITGYAPKLPNMENYQHDIYLSPRGSSWSWATWKNRWNNIDWEVKDWNEFKNNKIAINKFNQGGNDLFRMLELQMLGKIDSWAIRWVYHQFKVNMYTVYPIKSQISNNGFSDGKGIHNNTSNSKWEISIEEAKIKLEELQLNKKILEEFRVFYNLSFITKIGYFLKKYGMYNIGKRIYKLIIKRKIQ